MYGRVYSTSTNSATQDVNYQTTQTIERNLLVVKYKFSEVELSLVWFQFCYTIFFL